ncbi:MAG: hypothetical protein CM15mP59_1030 [Flavobacteriaceae bacterium]|nr:MAG: hypothetical protein CM15mP59_1030 [Flavobacteriaceae bacterium]
MVNRIFQPGVTTKREAGGWGYHYVEELLKTTPGSIQVRSTAENKGTHFEIALKR